MSFRCHFAVRLKKILYAQFSLAVSKTVATSVPDGSQTAVGSTVTVTDGITEFGHTHTTNSV